LAARKKILFVINPISGIGRQRTIEKAISRHLDFSLYEHEIAFTQYPHHAAEIAKNAAGNNFEVVVAVGGDGSANDIANGLLNSNTAMGIIPLGSGNGLAHHLKIPFRISMAIKVLNKYKPSKIDTATMNGKLFISIAGIGFDAMVADKFALQKRRGFRTYLYLVIKEFFKYKPSEYIIEANGNVFKTKALLISFANSDQFGNNISIAPKASISDGYLDLCIIKELSTLKAVRIAHKFFLKNIDSSRFVETIKIKEARISCDDFIHSHIDGDADEKVTDVHLRIQPKSLFILIP
jgi:YegS/Rv2252/BmrU family lipid kinase